MKTKLPGWPLQVMTFQQNHKVHNAKSVNLRSVWQANLFATSVYDSRIQGHWSSAKTLAPPKKLSAIPWPFLQLVFPMVSEHWSLPKEIQRNRSSFSSSFSSLQIASLWVSPFSDKAMTIGRGRTCRENHCPSMAATAASRDRAPPFR